MRRSRLLALVLALSGCYRDATTPPPPATASAHTCASASAKLGEIQRARHRDSPDEVKAFIAAVERACTQDAWPAAALACIDDASTHGAMKQCGKDHLTPAQRAHV